MDPVKRPPKGQSIRETIIQIVNQGGLKPNWFKDYHRNALRGQYARERISKEPHNIDEYKNYMVMTLFDPTFKGFLTEEEGEKLRREHPDYFHSLMHPAMSF